MLLVGWMLKKKKIVSKYDWDSDDVSAKQTEWTTTGMLLSYITTKFKLRILGVWYSAMKFNNKCEQNC